MLNSKRKTNLNWTFEVLRKNGMFVRTVWRPLNLYGPTIHDAQFDLHSTWSKVFVALGWSGRNARSDITNETDGGSSISTQVRVGLFQGSGNTSGHTGFSKACNPTRLRWGSANKSSSDPLTMWAHHFTIFNINCTKLTFKRIWRTTEHVINYFIMFDKYTLKIIYYNKSLFSIIFK